MKRMKQMLALLLAMIMVVSVLTACGEPKSTPDEAEPEQAIIATAVTFAKSGKYTTTVTSDKVDLSGITAKDVEISYVDTSDIALEEAQQSTATSDEEDFVLPTVKVKVTGVEANANGGYDISFTDENAPLNPTNYYDINFTKLEETASAEVVYPEITLTPDVENVVSDATQAKVTLAIDGSTFEDGISESDIYLDNAFSDMEIESVSSSDKNLTVQLKGSPVRNEAGAYQWGSVNVKPSGIKDGYADVTSKVDIQLASAYIDTATLKFENGKVNADLKVYGVVDINTLTKDNIKIDGATVETVEKADDNTVKLTIAADGVKSVNDFADLFGEKAMKLGDYETTVSVLQANFYPVFDYVEEDGDNLKITLKLYANGGSFDKNLKVDAISFADDFKDAKADSVKVDSDTVATLILSVPANGQTTETMAMNGTVTLAAGALTNAWGDKTSKEASYTRDYSGESLGRAVTLNVDTLLEIQKYTRGKNTTFGCILYWGGVAGQVYSIGKSILEAAGVLESDQAQLLRELAGINEKLDKISDQIDSVRKDIEGLVERDIQNKLSGYTSDMELLNKKIRDVSYVYDRARKDLAKTDEKYANIDWENMTDEQASEYNHVLIEYILSNAKPENLVYSSFIDDCNILKSKYESVTGMLERVGDSNPICLYDEACTYKYNFDSQAFAFRLAQRVYAETTLIKAYAALAIRYDAGMDPENPNAKTIIQDYDNAMESLQSLENIGHQASEIKAHPHYGEVADSNIYISDLMLAGMSTDDADAVKKMIIGNGYTPIDVDLNKGTNGKKIYLGYKTTTDINDAIRDIIIENGNLDTTRKYNQLYQLCPAEGDDEFVDSKGNLNCGVTYQMKGSSRGRGGIYSTTVSGEYLFLYYTKDSGSDGTAITKIYFNDKEDGSVKDLNNGTGGGENIYLHFDSAVSTASSYGLAENDPEYYPFSYVLGKKVSVWNSTEHDFSEKVDWRYAMLDRSSDVKCYKNWTDGEAKAFIARMNGRSLRDELKSAGITGTDSLVTYMNRAVALGGVVLLAGNCIYPGDSSLRTNQKIYMVAISNGSMVKNSEKQYINYSLFELH